MFDLNLSPSHYATSFVYEDDPRVLAKENIDALYDERISFDDNNSESCDSIDTEALS